MRDMHRLLRWLERHDMSKAELARRVGSTRDQISRYTTGQRRLDSLRLAAAIEDATGGDIKMRSWLRQ